MINSDIIGKIGESEAQDFLKNKGYTIIGKRFRPIKQKGLECGEIDIISKKGNEIIFTEVKTRKSKEELYYSITKKQKDKIIISAIEFIKQNPEYKEFDIRFDVILILRDEFKTKEINHIKNAFISEVNNFPF